MVLKDPEREDPEKFTLFYCENGSEDEKILGMETVKSWARQLIPENCTMNLEYVMFSEQEE